MVSEEGALLILHGIVGMIKAMPAENFRDALIKGQKTARRLRKNKSALIIEKFIDLMDAVYS